MDLGANPTKTFLRVTLPLIIPGILAAFLLSFALSIDDFIITYFVSGPSTTTFPVRIFGQSRTATPPQINVLASMILFGSIIVLAVATLFGQRRAAGSPAAEPGRARPAAKGISMRTVQHWIDGKPWDAPAGRTADVFDPSTGAVQAQVALAGPAEIDAAVQSARQASLEWREVPLARRARILFAFREVLERRKDELAAVISAEHGKVALRRARRGRAGPGGRRVRVRDPAPAEGRLLGVGVDRHRRPLDPPAARRRRRHHTVQLPGDGAHVDVPGCDRVRQRVRAQAERA